MNYLESLKKWTTIVADTGDFEQIAQFKPQDSTTNPSLIYAASKVPKYKHLVDDAVKFGKSFEKESLQVKCEKALDKVAVNFGLEILKLIPGRVSTELDARLSFDKEGTIKKGRDIIALYKAAGIGKERVLLKIASTWEGIEAAKVLEKEGIHCNLTLLFCLAQAIACAEAGAFLISPFVGRILDWHKKNGSDLKEDPGVVSVRQIFDYYKKFDYKTIIMGASFRSLEEITDLCGVDYLTISPKLLKKLAEQKGELKPKLLVEEAKKKEIKKVEITEKSFRWMLNEDQCGTEKLSEGIRRFAADLKKLEDVLKAEIQK